MTQQEIFDTIARHLLKQGRPAVSPVTGSCRYRTTDGLKCAAGALIPDEAYSPEIEGQASTNVLYLHDTFDGPEQDLIRHCQSAHDMEGDAARLGRDGTWLDIWKGRMRRVAVAYNLDPTILDKEDA